MRYDWTVWDFDGTLADTLALALVVFNELAAQHNFLPITDPVAVRELGTRAFLRQHHISLLRLPWLVRAYHQAVRGRMESVRLFDGLPSLLRKIRSAGCRLGVLSSNAADNIRVCLRANGVEDLFDFVVGYPRLFGKGRAIRRLLRRQGVEARRFLYVGDEVRDVKAAQKAGVDVAAVSWGFHALPLLAAQQPTFLWSNPEQVWSELFTLRADQERET